MNAFILIIPFLIIRFGLFGKFDKKTLQRAATFAPLEDNEKAAYFIYQITTLILVVFPLFLKIKISQPCFSIGCILYVLGILILLFSMIGFSKPETNGLNTNGIYKFSRNPMYVGYFIIFLSCVFLTQSITMLIALTIFQISAHWIIISEERWCLKNFGNEYKKYMNTVRRYL